VYENVYVFISFKEKAHEYMFVLPGPFYMEKEGNIFFQQYKNIGDIFKNRKVLMSLVDKLLECICSLVMFSPKF